MTRSSHRTRPDPRTARPRSLLIALLSLVVASLTFASSAQSATAIGLGTVESYAVLAGSGVTNTGPSVINGDLGTSPTASVTGFGGPPNGTVNGAIHQADAAAAQAKDDLTTAYNNAAGQGPVTTRPTELGGQTLTPGVYNSASGTFGVTGPLTLNAQGNPDAVFIFKMASTLTTASASSVNLINGAQACRVYWQVGSSASLGTNSDFVGNLMALQSISLNSGVDVAGRLLARNGAVTLINDTVTRAQCAGGGGEGGGGDGGGGDGGGGNGGGGGGNGGGGNGGDGTGGGGGNTPSSNIRISTGGDNCVARAFTARFRIQSNSPMRRVKVFLDGDLIERTTRKNFSVRIQGRGLSAGRHTLKVVAVNVDGRRGVDRRNFRRCEAAVPNPPFTG